MAVFEIYLELQSVVARRLSGSLAGRMVLSVASGPIGGEFAVAAAIAGGAVLGIDPDAEHLKTAVRDGSCDFMVNTLDEALRILKNELRKGTTVSVCLEGNPSVVLSTMVEHGVQPDLVADVPESSHSKSGVERSALQQMIERGAVAFTPSDQAISGSPASDSIVWTAATPGDLRRLDAIACDLLSVEDRTRRLWLERAEQFFYRQPRPERVFAMQREERERLVEAFQAARLSGAIHNALTLMWRGPDRQPQTVTM